MAPTCLPDLQPSRVRAAIPASTMFDASAYSGHLHGHQADRAGPEHNHQVAGTYPALHHERVVGDADRLGERRFGQVDVIGDVMQDALAHGHVRRVGPVDQHAEAEAVGAEVVVPPAALGALAADVSRRLADHPVARLEIDHLEPTLCHSARELVTQDHRRAYREGDQVVVHLQVATAYAHGAHLQ